jgi:hypothetical protein
MKCFPKQPLTSSTPLLEGTRRAITKAISFVVVTGVLQIRRRQFWEVREKI